MALGQLHRNHFFLVQSDPPAKCANRKDVGTVLASTFLSEYRGRTRSGTASETAEAASGAADPVGAGEASRSRHEGHLVLAPVPLRNGPRSAPKNSHATRPARPVTLNGIRRQNGLLSHLPREALRGSRRAGFSTWIASSPYCVRHISLCETFTLDRRRQRFGDQSRGRCSPSALRRDEFRA